jgi:hypothetical protein
MVVRIFFRYSDETVSKAFLKSNFRAISYTEVAPGNLFGDV